MHYQRVKKHGDPEINHKKLPIGTRRVHARTGYVKIKIRDTGFIEHDWVYEHRLVMENVLGRSLAPGEVVHHKDGNRWNSSPENLELTTLAEHQITHHPELFQNQARDSKGRFTKKDRCFAAKGTFARAEEAL